jgi:hypothetical protein
MDCDCRGVVIYIHAQTDAYQMTRLDKDLNPVDSISAFFGSGSDPVYQYVYQLDKYSFPLQPGESVADFTYVLTYNVTHRPDTISGITYEAVSEVSKCNTCFLASDKIRCDKFIHASVKLNGEVKEGFQVTLP